MTQDFLSRRIMLAGRRRLVHAPAGDYSFSRYTRGGSFRDFRRLCQGLLTPDSVMLDIGANIGLSSMVAADLLPAGRIYAIEAAPRNVSALRANVSEHGLSQVRPLHCAVGATEGVARFFENSAFGHVVSGGGMVDWPAAEVPQRTIDGIVADEGLTRLDFIKIDIEGFEQDALAGAAETLARFDPVVFLEFNSWCQIASYDRSPRRFLEWLLASFPELHLWRDRSLTSIRDQGVYEFLHAHLTKHRCNDDLVGVRAPEKLARLKAMRGEGVAALLRLKR